MDILDDQDGEFDGRSSSEDEYVRPSGAKFEQEGHEFVRQQHEAGSRWEWHNHVPHAPALRAHPQVPTEDYTMYSVHVTDDIKSQGGMKRRRGSNEGAIDDASRKKPKLTKFRKLSRKVNQIVRLHGRISEVFGSLWLL